jgi:hypothetical protein
MPFPWLFWRYGAAIRMRCRFAAEAAEVLAVMRAEVDAGDVPGESAEADEEVEEAIERIISRRRTAASSDQRRQKDEEKAALDGQQPRSDDERTVSSEKAQEERPGKKVEEGA